MKKEVKKEMMDVIKPSESCILKVWQLDDGIYLKQEDRLLRICPQTEVQSGYHIQTRKASARSREKNMKTHLKM